MIRENSEWKKPICRPRGRIPPGVHPCETPVTSRTTARYQNRWPKACSGNEKIFRERNIFRCLICGPRWKIHLRELGLFYAGYNNFIIVHRGVVLHVARVLFRARLSMRRSLVCNIGNGGEAPRSRGTPWMEGSQNFSDFTPDAWVDRNAV